MLMKPQIFNLLKKYFQDDFITKLYSFYVRVVQVFKPKFLNITLAALGPI